MKHQDQNVPVQIFDQFSVLSCFDRYNSYSNTSNDLLCNEKIKQRKHYMDGR